MNCHDEDGKWWCYRARTEQFSAPYPHFTMYAASGTMLMDASVSEVLYYETVGEKRITTLTYGAHSTWYWDNYAKEGHHYLIHWLSYLPNFRERHIELLNPANSTFNIGQTDGVQNTEVEDFLMTIPNNPAPNEEWTNDATGITYTWNGERWLIKTW